MAVEENNYSQDDTVSLGRASVEDIRNSRSRLFVVSGMFIFVFMALIFRLIEVSVFKGGKVFTVKSYDEFYDDDIKTRADITDRNGTLLAVNLSTASLYANPKVILDIDDAVKKVSAIFPETDAASLKSKLSSDKHFVWIKRNLTPKEQYKINELGLPGLYFKEEEKRIYPHKNLMSHILGFVDVDGKGISGIERKFNTYLSGSNNIGGVNEALQLSVDIRVQSVVRDVLSDAMEEFKALGAAGIVLDADTGEVISMVSMPDFNLNNPGDADHDAKFNRATYGVYEMGSTFKVFNMALGFEKNNLKLKDIFDVSEPIKVARFTIRDYHQKKKELTASEVFMFSSNIASVQIAVDAGEEAQREFLGRLGLLDELEIEIPEKSEPLYPDNWGKVSAVTISYGHGIAVTPMHVASATAALVNGGVLNPVTLLKKSRFSFLNSGVRVVQEDTSDKIRKIMRLAVKHGTGKNSDVEGYLVGGKTGSADKPKEGKYNTKVNISSFVSAFPMNEPKYVVLVMMDEPVGNAKTGGFTTGGMVAAPVAGEVIKRIAPILGVTPVDENDYEIQKEFWYDNERDKQQVAITAVE
ncbi:MAG: penicillin-binding protein [Alphaproteobacteria bacterium CG11_big_fil_rev_8_21_14_0_20_39_49]|nr:MAG: penicillin-binding protein [Alphaproteobacteria bacterium CG11_big_fil_rev_8_21_14_0_20_39_49]